MSTLFFFSLADCSIKCDYPRFRDRECFDTRKDLEDENMDLSKLTDSILQCKHLWFLHVLEWISKERSKFTSQY